MKILDLQLAAFGPFTGKTLNFGDAAGMHIIYGPNEAGKSAALRALRGWLYGIPERTADVFVHEKEKLRIGGTIAGDDGKRLTFVRRKGRINTLLDADDHAINDRALAPFLAGVSEQVFTAMFGMDHQELVEGGRQLASGGGEIGASLFAAGMGISGLRGVMEDLAARRDELFKPTGSKPRLNALAAQYKEAQRAVAEASLSPREWAEHDEAMKAAKDEADKLAAELKRVQHEKARLERLAKAIPLIARRVALAAQLAAIGEVKLLSEEAPQLRREAQKALAQAEANEQKHTKELKRLADEIGKLSIPADLLSGALEEQDLHQRLGGFIKAQEDLPGLERDRRRLLGEAQRILGEIRPGLPIAEAGPLRLPPHKQARVLDLSSRYQTCMDATAAADRAVADLEAELDTARRQRESLSAPADPRELRLALEAAAEHAPAEKQMADAQAELDQQTQDAYAQLQRLDRWRGMGVSPVRPAGVPPAIPPAERGGGQDARQTLGPEAQATPTGTLEELETQVVPAIETIDRFDAQIDNLAQEFRQAREKVDSACAEIDDIDRQIQGLASGRDIPTEGDLAEARRVRDELWEKIKTHWAEPASLSPEGAEDSSRGRKPPVSWATPFQSPEGAKEGSGGTEHSVAPSGLDSSDTPSPGADAPGYPLAAPSGPRHQRLEWVRGPLSAQLASEFQRAIARADEIADRLRAEADVVARQSALASQRQRAQQLKDDAEAQVAEVAAAQAKVQREWESLWQPAGIAAGTPKEMRGWLARRDELLRAAQQIRKQKAAADSLASVVAQQRAALAEALRQAGQVSPGSDTLRKIIARAKQVVAEHTDAAEAIRSSDKEIKQLEGRLKKARAAGKQASDGLGEWRDSWGAAVAELGLAADALPAEASAVVSRIGELFGNIDKAEALTDRIEAIDADSRRFHDDARQFIERTAPDLLVFSDDQMISLVHERAARAQRDSATLKELQSQQVSQQKDLDAARESAAGAARRLAELCRAAGCAGVEELEPLEQRSQQARELTRQIAQNDGLLAQHAATGGIETLVAEASGVDPDALPGQIQRAAAQAAEIQELLDRAKETIVRERVALESMDGSSQAAAAAQQSQELLAEIRRQAQQYIRLHLACGILQREMERYRDANQGPVLKLAGELFARLTLGSFAGIRPDYGDGDRAVLTGVRPGGQKVGVDGLSEGTRDQLYLALRLGSLMRHLELSPPLPFIIDDILVNFDDDRSRAALLILGELSGRTQVIYFTHHQHVVELAKAAMNGGLRVHRLGQ